MLFWIFGKKNKQAKESEAEKQVEAEAKDEAVAEPADTEQAN